LTKFYSFSASITHKLRHYRVANFVGYQWCINEMFGVCN